MILSDAKILEGLQDKSIIISDFNLDNLNPTSYDVTLNNKFKIYKNNILDCKLYNETEEFIIPEEGFILQPGEFYLYSTNEVIGSTKYSSEIKNKSSLARLGLIIHYVASWIDVGFTGNITLEMSVQKQLKIYPNMKIGQLIFHEISGEILESYDRKKGSKYMNQSGVQESLMHKNFEK
jgi:dCTP deaminase